MGALTNFASSVWSSARDRLGRSRRVEAKLDLLVAENRSLREDMAKTDKDVLDAIKEVKALAEQHFKDEQARIDTAVESALSKAKSAWEADDEAEHEEMLAELEALKGSLKPPVFSPSGN